MNVCIFLKISRKYLIAHLSDFLDQFVRPPLLHELHQLPHRHYDLASVVAQADNVVAVHQREEAPLDVRVHREHT